jgi:hypothetical protein
MKRLRVLLLLPLMLLASCNDGKTDNEGNAMYSQYGPNFSLVCSHSFIDYLRDIDTDIMYFMWDNGSGGKRAGWSTYYNKDGQPMTYAEFKDVHMSKYH